jgi:phosphatidylglycerophosphate synthase
MAGSPELLIGRRGRPWRALLPAATAAALGVAAGSWVQIIDRTAAAVALLCFLVGAGLIAERWPRAVAPPHSARFGAANGVTLSRVVGTSWVAALASQALLGDLTRSGQALLVVIGTVCLILDGVDGRLARSRGEASDFGARFDVETDAALLLFLSVAVGELTAVGWWVLAVAGLRYIYVAASWVVPALRIPLPYSYARKVVAVAQAVALLVALVLDLVGTPTWLPTTILVAGLACLCWSFGRDIAFQLRHR